jgi:glucuronate isomerase
MKPFMDKDFLLQTETARKLYHEEAEGLPIIDYHCHLNPREVAEDHRFANITELWLGSDHYKWRALRSNGVDEHFITGDASDWEKFEKWAETVPYCMRNPIYHWTHLELRTAFGIQKLLNPSTAREIYEECNEKLRQPEFSARGLMRRYRVEVVCTTDDPADSLEYHKQTAQSGFEIKVLPTWRPDKAMAIENPKAYRAYIEQLSQAAGCEIHSYADLLDALQKRHDYFAANGCKLSDHGLENFYSADYKESEIDLIFKKALIGIDPAPDELEKFRSAFLHDQAVMDAEAGWAQQFHIGAIRNNNTKMFAEVGADTGYDAIHDLNIAVSGHRFFDRLTREGKLAKTILYCLNPKDNAVMTTMAYTYNDGTFPGKMQFGSGWWFLDQEVGMRRQLDSLSNLGLLSRFVGMLTDSRSFVSYPRHEYFRRILCDVIGSDVEKGKLPASEMEFIGQMVEDISYNNAKRYFDF